MLGHRIVKVPLEVALPLAVVLLLTGLGCLAYVVARSRWPGRVLGGLLLCAAVWWELANAAVEGKVLVAVAKGHGLRMADVVALQAGLIGVALAVGPRRRPRREDGHPPVRRHDASAARHSGG